MYHLRAYENVSLYTPYSDKLSSASLGRTLAVRNSCCLLAIVYEMTSFRYPSDYWLDMNAEFYNSTVQIILQFCTICLSAMLYLVGVFFSRMFVTLYVCYMLNKITYLLTYCIVL